MRKRGMSALVAKLQALSSLSQQALESHADEIDAEAPSTTFNAARTRDLEGLCTKERVERW